MASCENSVRIYKAGILNKYQNASWISISIIIALFIGKTVTYADFCKKIPGFCGNFLDFPPQSCHEGPE